MATERLEVIHHWLKFDKGAEFVLLSTLGEK